MFARAATLRNFISPAQEMRILDGKSGLLVGEGDLRQAVKKEADPAGGIVFLQKGFHYVTDSPHLLIDFPGRKTVDRHYALLIEHILKMGKPFGKLLEHFPDV